MSYTTIYKFTAKGNAHAFAETHNAFRGAMAVWMQVEEKYLPSLPRPSWAHGPMYKEDKYWSRTGTFETGQPDDPMNDIWKLVYDDKTSWEDKIALCSTFDKVIVARENIDQLLPVFDQFTNTTLPEQAEAIRTLLLKDKKFIAISWNQTSVNSDTWSNNFGYSKPYNILKQDDHYELFTFLKNEAKK